ncbi:MAG: OadG family protein [Bacteroidales bacterium]|jgi:Na+-transporting methylmalonyl-CoA/oxaloacetate decarboxylase gamma subunit|nr:OadG family protein [Bacteroidales bacterium]
MEILAIVWGEAFAFAGFCMLVVFTVLTLLVGVLTVWGKVMAKQGAKQQVAAAPVAAPVRAASAGEPNEQEKAAIAAALYLFFGNNHDIESYAITMKDVQSPWNDKSYGINNLHR